MKLWSCTSFHGFYPVGTAAVVVAESRERAAENLNEVLERNGLKQPVPLQPSDFLELGTDREIVYILRDGNY